MKTKIFQIAVIFLLLVNAGLVIWVKLTSVKIAYVRSSELVNGYLGMKEARNTYELKLQLWQANVDTLKLDYQRALNKYNNELTNLSIEEKKLRVSYLQKQESNLIQYSEIIKQKAKQEDEKMTQGVLNQVNSFVQEYAVQHGYDIVLGTTLSGSILYGIETIDITDELLKALNKVYKGE